LDCVRSNYIGTATLSFRFAIIWLSLLSTFLSDAAPVEARLPNGRLITPQGDWLALAPYPFALAIRPDGQQVVVPSIGYPFSLNIVDRPGSPAAKLTRSPNTSRNVPEVEVHAGVAY
jgi:hypothetical protein